MFVGFLCNLPVLVSAGVKYIQVIEDITHTLQKVIAGKAKAFDGEPVPESFLQPQLPADDPVTQEATIISKEDIKYERKIGEGAHGTVYEATWSNKHGSVSEGVSEGVSE